MVVSIRESHARIVRVTLATLVSLVAALRGTATAATLPPNFRESTAFGGLVRPTVVKFAPDGRVFVAEKSGVIRVFDSISSTTPTVFADLRPSVHDFWDRGLLGMAVDPQFANGLLPPLRRAAVPADSKAASAIPICAWAWASRKWPIQNWGSTTIDCRANRLASAGSRAAAATWAERAKFMAMGSSSRARRTAARASS